PANRVPAQPLISLMHNDSTKSSASPQETFVLGKLRERACQFGDSKPRKHPPSREPSARVPLSAITEISEMAINAGFKDIRPFVLWHKTGRMAQIQFGPAIKSTLDPDKIAK